jgi:hypothetical protein
MGRQEHPSKLLIGEAVRKNFAYILFSLILMAGVNDAKAYTIDLEANAFGAVNGQYIIQASWVGKSNKSYKLRVYGPTGMEYEIDDISVSNVSVDVDGRWYIYPGQLECNTYYVVKVRQKGRASWKQQGVFTTACPPTRPPASSVRIRNVVDAQCLFNEVNDDTVRSWACSESYTTAYTLVDLGGGEYHLKHWKSGKCITAGPNSGDYTESGTCSSSNARQRFTLDPFLSGFRLISGNNLCLATQDWNNAKTSSWGCWGSAGFEFRLENIW